MKLAMLISMRELQTRFIGHDEVIIEVDRQVLRCDIAKDRPDAL